MSSPASPFHSKLRIACGSITKTIATWPLVISLSLSRNSVSILLAPLASSHNPCRYSDQSSMSPSQLITLEGVDSDTTSDARPKRTKAWTRSPTTTRPEKRIRTATAKAHEAAADLDSDELENVLESYEHTKRTTPRRGGGVRLPAKTSTPSPSPSSSPSGSATLPTTQMVLGPFLNRNRESYFWHEPSFRLLPVGDEHQFDSSGNSWEILVFPANSYYGPPLPSDTPESTFTRQQPCVSSCKYVHVAGVT